ncbi:DUF1064 domain-containing protein [Vibrio phage PVP-XSN]|uniref:DUF1064 domain-containing protein n=1 Tax=Vibrio phage PVP-XSN TaxID=3056214 RepID=A0AAX3Y6I3_9CAUD|nr:DUF1064 domain-containing protein [Vibrio phage PVP-XSN]
MNKQTLALGRMKSGKMNKTEQEYEQQLKWRQRAGEIAWYKFEGVKLRLADSTFYTPDFFVMLSDGTLEVHEVKGHWRDDARVKIKVAADMYPFVFIAATKKGSKFTFEQF